MMKQVILILVAFSLLSTAYAQKMTVASYNIRYENQGDKEKSNGWQQRYPVITQFIRFHDFDNFGSQEVLNEQ